jgi:DNA-binding NarL/FixJ family response regulator
VRVLLIWHEISRCLLADMLRNRFNGFLLTTCLPETSLKAIRAVSRGEAWMSHEALAIASTDLWEPAGLSPVDTGISANAILADASGRLTPRESQVVALVRRGCINKEIACELAITEDTVKKHLQSVFAKLGVHRRTLVALRPFQHFGANHSGSRIDADARPSRKEGFGPPFATAPLHDRRRLC